MDQSASLAAELPTESSAVEDLLEHREFLYRVVNGLLGDSHDSDDVVQQTWVAVLTTSSDTVRKPKTWLAKIAKNRSIDLIRRRRVRRVREQGVDEPSSGPSPDESLENDSVRSTVCEAVSRLSEPYRTSIELRFFEGLPPREVARRMGVPVETARTRIKRALASLRTRLDSDFPGGREAWVTACIRFIERQTPAPILHKPWKPIALAAGLLALFSLGAPKIEGTESTAGESYGDETPVRVVLRAPGLPGWNETGNAQGESDALGEENGWDTWPPVPAVEVESEFRRGKGFEHPLEHTTWAAIVETAAVEKEQPKVARTLVGGHAIQAVSVENQSFGSGSLSSVAASLDDSSPLDVDAEDRIIPANAWTVDPSGAGDFTDVPSAAAAASSGDVLILEANPAGYDGARLIGKGLSILGRGEEPVWVRGLLLHDLEANENMILRNVRLETQDGTTAVDMRNVRGSVWIEECTIKSLDADAMSVHDCAAIAIIRSEASVELTQEASEPFTALRAFASDFSVHESTFYGHAGLDSDAETAGSGGHGAVLHFGRLFAMESHFEGGPGGGAHLSGTQTRGGDGGIGLWTEGETRSLNCTYAGGPAGSGPQGDGTDGMEQLGVLENLCGSARSYRVDALTGSLGVATLEARGAPGDVLMSVVGAAPSKGYLLLHLGTRLVAPPYAFVVEGVIPPSGEFKKTIEIPSTVALGGGFERYYTQGFFFDLAGDAYLASASTVFVLPWK